MDFTVKTEEAPLLLPPRVLGKSSRLGPLRTYTNGRCTSARLHSTPLPLACRFCSLLVLEGDNIRHCTAECNMLAVALDTAVPTLAGPWACLARFGLAPQQVGRAAFVSMVFRTWCAQFPKNIPIQLLHYHHCMFDILLSGISDLYIIFVVCSTLKLALDDHCAASIF